MPSTTQISARILLSTKDALDRTVRTLGTTQTHLVEQALQHHLRALNELPPSTIVPARLVLSKDSAEQVRDLVESPSKPTDHMKRLFDDR